MKRKGILAVAIAFVVILTSMTACFVAFGSDVTWEYDSSSQTLYIHGTTEMEDYGDQYDTPWNGYINSVKSIIIDEGVKSIGAYSFAGMSRLESIVIPSTVTSIKSYSLSSCSSLKELNLGGNITSIADDSFAYDGLQRKADFVVNALANTYPLYYMFAHDVPFNAESVCCGAYKTTVSVGGMRGIFPYTPKCDGTFRFYSSGGFDTIGYLYDSNHNQIAKNDDASASNTNFSITANLTKGETYYFSAALFSTGMRGSFNVTLEAVNFTVDGSVVAMADPSGAASDLEVTTALMDNEAVGSSFVIDVTGGSITKTFICGSQSQTITFTPDKDGTVVFMMCDVNDDGYVNAKDYAIMRRTDSTYLPLYGSFINYCG